MKISLLIVFLPLVAVSQEFEDRRDGITYTCTQIASLYWMTENLRYVEEGSVCLKDCELIRFYDYRYLEEVCPEGWRLPEVNEWDDFANSFENTEKVKMLEGNEKLYRVDFLDKFNIFKSNVLNIKPYGRVEGGKSDTMNSIDFWTINPATDNRFHMHLTPHSITGHTHKHHLSANKPEEFRLFPVRCVCDELE